MKFHISKYSMKKLRGWESNPRHSAYETELEPLQSTPQCLVGIIGIEPITFRVSDECSNQLSYIPIKGK
jgi:hypothetical protein